MGKLKLDQVEWEFFVNPDVEVKKNEPKIELTWILDSNLRLLQQLNELPNYQVKKLIEYAPPFAIKMFYPGCFFTHERQ